MVSPTITNPTPFTPNLCGTIWVTSAELYPNDLHAELAPTDGTYLVVDEGRQVNVDLRTDAAAKAAADVLFAQVQRLAGKTAAVTSLILSAPSPRKKVTALATFADKSPAWRCADVLALVASDMACAAAYEAFVAYLATK